jgi:hypothetical protein
MALTTNQGLIVPDGTDNANVPLTFTDFVTTAGSGVENRLVQRYLSVADRTARNPAPNEGELSYLSDVNRYDSFTGSVWTPLINPSTFAVNTAPFPGLASLVYTTVGPALLGVTFVVPQSGQVRVDWMANLDNTLTTATTFVSPQLNAGNVIGAGATITASSDSIAISNFGQSAIGVGGFYIYTGLTPGADVNAFLQYRVDGGAGALSQRKIALSQA